MKQLGGNLTLDNCYLQNTALCSMKKSAPADVIIGVVGSLAFNTNLSVMQLERICYLSPAPSSRVSHNPTQLTSF